jgi:hypothetical protein
MKTFFESPKALILAAALAVGLSACGVSGDGTGRLSLSLIDKPTHDYKAVFVTIQDVYVHAESDAEGSWTKILDVNRTIDLLTLANGVREELGMVDLAPGHYTQMRLMIGTSNATDPALPANYIVDTKDQIQSLKIPSGVQSGIKLVQGFDINASSTTRLIFDFDVAASIVAAGNSGKYILRPTIHQIDDTQTRTIVKGFVKDGEAAGVAGANVSLQVYMAPAEGLDAKDEVAVPYSTVTDETGAYLFWFLDVPTATTFNVVATDWASTEPKYGPAWAQKADVMNGDAYVVDDLVLPNPTDFGTLDVRAIIVDADADKVAEDTLFVTISIRQATALPGEPMVEVMKQVIVAFDDEWALNDIQPVKIDLPAGTYTVVASVDGRDSLKEVDVSITKDTGTAIDFSFPLPPTP